MNNSNYDFFSTIEDAQKSVKLLLAVCDFYNHQAFDNRLPCNLVRDILDDLDALFDCERDNIAQVLKDSTLVSSSHLNSVEHESSCNKKAHEYISHQLSKYNIDDSAYLELTEIDTILATLPF